MSTKVKSILALLTTLIIGMILGALILSTVMKKRMDRFKNSTPKDRTERLKKMIVRVSEADEAQSTALGKIIDIQTEDWHQFEENFRNKMSERRDLLLSELETVLSPEQIEKIQNHMDKHPRGPRKKRRH